MRQIPALTTTRCLLRPICIEDREGVVSLLCDPQVREYLGGPLDQSQAGLKFDSIFASSGSTWIARRKSDDAFLGMIDLDRHHDAGRTEVSYQFATGIWGGGFATECVSRVIQFAFEVLGLTELVAETQTANIASNRLLRRLGMRVERTVRRFDAEQAIYVLNHALRRSCRN